MIAPGVWGLNTEQANNLLSPKWCTEATNAVVNDTGRLAARSGWGTQTATPIVASDQIEVIHEYILQNRTSVTITTANNKIYKDVDDFTDVANDITSSTAPTDDNWQFVNFNDYVIGVQRGHAPIQWQNSGDFTDISFTGTGYDGDCIAAGFGRVWAADADLQTLRYSTLLDHTDMTTSGGTIDMDKVWTAGTDEIKAIVCMGANLIVFGMNHIVFWGDRSGSAIGLNPINLEIVDIIEGTGCIARDSIQMTGDGDLIFLSRWGLQSLGRVIQSKSNPTVALTEYVRGNFQNVVTTDLATDTRLDRVRSTFNPDNGLYIINFPTSNIQYVFDTSHPFPDPENGQPIWPITTWQLGGPVVGLCTMRNGNLLFGAAGEVGKYSLEQDDGSAYTFAWTSGWLDFGDPQINHRIKMLKELLARITIGEGSVTWNWEFDFTGSASTRTVAYTGGYTAQYNISEFSDSAQEIGYIDPAVGAASGETEYSGQAVIQRKTLPMHGEGQFLQMGATVSVDGFQFTLQQISISPKLGRMIT
jgi:hypothetical protein